MEEQAVYGGKFEPEKHADNFKPFEFWDEEKESEPRKDELEIDTQRFIAAWKEMQEVVHDIAVSKGWWDTDRSDGEILALIHSEISECLEACRKGYPQDKHCPEHGNAQVELADSVIRVMDFAESKGWDVASALMEKVIFNRSRPRKHGKLF